MSGLKKVAAADSTELTADFHIKLQTESTDELVCKSLHSVQKAFTNFFESAFEFLS